MMNQCADDSLTCANNDPKQGSVIDKLLFSQNQFHQKEEQAHDAHSNAPQDGIIFSGF